MQMLDFNALQQPTWPVKLKDKDQTVVTLSVPSVDLVERLAAAIPALEKVTQTKDGTTIRASYALVAEIMSCNEDGFTFTAEELRDTYRLTLPDLFKFASGYFDFINEIQDAKN